MKAEVIYQCQNITGEAATWLPQLNSLLWVDIEGKTLFEYSIERKDVKKHYFKKMVTTIIPCKHEGNQVVLLALQNELATYNLLTKQCEKLVDIPISNDELRTNDGKSSPDGQIWLGVMHYSNHKETGSLYTIDNQLQIRKVLDRQCIPNGMVWNKAGDKMYYADSGKSCIYEFLYDKENATITSPRVAIKVPAEYGIPDGMTIDAQDRLWVAHWGGYGVYVWDVEQGELRDKVDVSAPNVASCTFGGADNRTLFITTARAGLSPSQLEQYPLSGSLFAVATNVVGGQNHYPFS